MTRLIYIIAATLFATSLSINLNGQHSLIVGEALANEQSPAHELYGDFIAPNVSAASSVVADTFVYIDFANGLADWSFVNTMPDSVQLWEYETNTNLNAENNDGRFATFNSPSADNGFLWFDYRKRLIEIDYQIGDPPYPQLVQSAISPTLDLSSLDPAEAYAVNFYSYQPTLNIRNCRLVIRNADGSGAEAIIWTAFDEIARPNVATPGLEFARIPEEFVGASGVELVFIHDGDFYGWAVDDILITQRPRNDGAITDFFARAANNQTPASEASAYPLAFVADIANNGAADQGMRLAITIEDDNDVLIYTDTLDYANIESDSTFQNSVFPTSFPMPTAVGSYEGIYTLITSLSDDDVDLDNNVQRFEFEVTEDYYSRSGSLDDGGVRPSAMNEEYATSNLYLLPSLQSGDSVYITELAFRAIPRDFTDNDLGFLELSVYGWRGDLNGDGIPSFDDNPDDSDIELVQLSLKEYTVDATWGDSLVRTSPTEEGDAVAMPLDEDYIGFAVSLGYFPAAGAGNTDNRFFTGQVGFENSAYTLATDSLGAPIYLYTLSIPETPTLTYGFFNNRTPFLDARIKLGTIVGVSELSSAEFAISPNPTSSQLFIDLDLADAAAGQAQISVHNAVGQLVISRQEALSAKQRIMLATEGLNEGLYYLELTTADGRQAVRKFMVQR